MGVNPDDAQAPLPDRLADEEDVRKDSAGNKLWNPRWGARVDHSQNKAFISAVVDAVIANEKVRTFISFPLVAHLPSPLQASGTTSEVPAESLTQIIARPVVTAYFRHLDQEYGAQTDPALRAKRDAHADLTRRRLCRDTVRQNDTG